MQYQTSQKYYSFASAIQEAFYNAIRFPDLFDIERNLANINAGIFNDRTALYSSYYHNIYNPSQLYYSVDSVRQAVEINYQINYQVKNALEKLSQTQYNPNLRVTSQIYNNLKTLLYKTAIQENNPIAQNGLINILFKDYSAYNTNERGVLNFPLNNIAFAQLENYKKIENQLRLKKSQLAKKPPRPSVSGVYSYLPISPSANKTQF